MSAGEARVLVVDDEPQIVRGLKVILQNAGYRVEEATTKKEALDSVSVRPPDAIVLDLVLPDGDGVEVTADIRRWSSLPIVVLSAVGDEEQKVRALDAGADDYVTKPFGSEELLARMRAVLRRRSEEGDAPVRIGDLEIDLADRSVRRAGEDVHLTPIEFDLLSRLAQHPGRLVTHRQLLQEVWGPGYEDETHYLRVHFAHVRAKIEPDPANPRYVITEPGIGYRLQVEE
ncbi:MAG TPA: response regulator [Solirubrobacterales bacterium]|jgi:two-component system KDP operon response regulator KdpE